MSDINAKLNYNCTDRRLFICAKA